MHICTYMSIPVCYSMVEIPSLDSQGLRLASAGMEFGLRIPGDAGQLFFAGFPFGAGKDARGDIDQARSEFEDSGSVPGAAVAGAIFADIERFGHAGERNILNNHFGKEAERLHFERVIFQVTAISADAKAKGNFLGSGRKRLRLGSSGRFHFALPLEGDESPAGVVHFRKIGGCGEDAHPFAHAIDFFHGSLPDGRFSNAEDVLSHRKFGQFPCRGLGAQNLQNQKDFWQKAPVGRMVNVRWRDESVALPDTGSLVAARASPDT